MTGHSKKHTAMADSFISLLSRRQFPEAAGPGVGGTLFSSLFSDSMAQAAAGAGKKILIVYFSRTGNTRSVVEQIQARVGGDMLELKTLSECVKFF